ncbi:zinc finger protein 639 [Gracilinanus agilis]|uniref:zinc finger protein 639 n=1 Tax=Gracilinanus agilis TaxID=191870 RepID=UPI001CFEBEDB|nr:zinc finger protein 639 [Gracilinanus agilis]
MNEHPKKRKRKTLHPSRYSDSTGITKIADGFNGIFSDHCYSVCSMRQPDLKYFENKDDDSDTETSNDLPKFSEGIRRSRNQNHLVPSPVLRILDHSAFSAERSAADVEICEECESPEPTAQPPREESPVEVRTAEDVPIAAEVHAVSEDYDAEPENLSSESLQEPPAEEPPGKPCRLLDKSQGQPKWPLLRANSSGLYKCELCQFNSKYFSDLKQHAVLKHKRPDEGHVCRVCRESFPSGRRLLEHAKRHEEEPYPCKYCDYRAVLLESLSQHIADAHFGDHLYWCEQCDAQFSSSSELYLHFQEHSCDEQYLCQFCEHETNDPEDLHSHVVNEHACRLIELSDQDGRAAGGARGPYSLLAKISFDKCRNFFVCQVCGFRSRLHTNVNRHVAIEHTKIFPHVCDDCGKGFSSMLEYCKHLNSHLAEGIYLCQYCEYSTGQIEDLKTHLDFRHAADLPHKCTDCLMRFGSERELLGHLAVHETA